MSELNIAFIIEDTIDESSAEIIKDAVAKLNGALEVVVYFDINRVVIEYDSERLSEDVLRGTIEDAGFKVR